LFSLRLLCSNFPDFGLVGRNKYLDIFIYLFIYFFICVPVSQKTTGEVVTPIIIIMVTKPRWMTKRSISLSMFVTEDSHGTLLQHISEEQGMAYDLVKRWNHPFV